MTTKRPLMVLFLSTGNAGRSIVAEALLRAKGSIRFTARSAGFRPRHSVDPQTLALLKAEGIPTEGLHAKGWAEFLAAAHLVPIDVIVTLSEEARQNCPPWPANMSGVEPVKVHWSIDDPLSAQKEEVREWKFRKCFNTLESRISALMKTRPAACAGELLLQLKDIGMVV